MAVMIRVLAYRGNPAWLDSIEENNYVNPEVNFGSSGIKEVFKFRDDKEKEDGEVEQGETPEGASV